jgi:uncharacterized membrane protein
VPPWQDLVGLAVFALMWFGYGPAIHRLAPGSINARLGGLRVAWMRTMLRRDNRIVDSSLIGHVVHSASFFASTSLIVIGALLSLLSSVEHLQPALESLAFVAPASRTLFELKVLLPLAIMVHGFVKFTWSIRQLNYTIALIGAAPDRAKVGPFLERLALTIGGVMTAALTSFNDGMRSYYYAIAALAWLVGPWEMAASAILLTAMLVWRQIRSPAAHGFRAALAATIEAQNALDGGGADAADAGDD